jgi:hypothetical protein
MNCGRHLSILDLQMKFVIELILIGGWTARLEKIELLLRLCVS